MSYPGSKLCGKSYKAPTERICFVKVGKRMREFFWSSSSLSITLHCRLTSNEPSLPSSSTRLVLSTQLSHQNVIFLSFLIFCLIPFIRTTLLLSVLFHTRESLDLFLHSNKSECLRYFYLLISTYKLWCPCNTSLTGKPNWLPPSFSVLAHQIF